MANPELILMDEPSEGLALRLVLQVGDIVKRMKARGHAIRLVEQKFQLVLSAGRFVFQGTAVALTRRRDILDEHVGVSGSKAAGLG